MASFLNPNDPPQPQEGVYGWFVRLADGARCIYVGEAGRRPSANENGTLLRDATELSRTPLSSDKHYQRLDTDFVVGTAIRFFETHYGPVFWEHLSDNPDEEECFVKKYRPIIQKAGKAQILPQLKVRMSQPQYWKCPRTDLGKCAEKLNEANMKVCEELKKLVANNPLQNDCAARRC